MSQIFGSIGSLIIPLLPIILMVFVFTRLAKKQRAREEERREEAIEVGNWVLTRAGFYGRIVEIDGEVVVLETHLGDESVWDVKSVVAQKNPPVAQGSTLLNESEVMEIADELAVDSPLDSTSDSVTKDK